MRECITLYDQAQNQNSRTDNAVWFRFDVTRFYGARCYIDYTCARNAISQRRRCEISDIMIQIVCVYFQMEGVL